VDKDGTQGTGVANWCNFSKKGKFAIQKPLEAIPLQLLGFSII